jgi:hypothetical protein
MPAEIMEVLARPGGQRQDGQFLGIHAQGMERRAFNESCDA